MDLEQYLKTEGPFDGLIAFSQGTALASAFLLELIPRFQSHGQTYTPSCQCAVFVCGRLPFLDTGMRPYPQQADCRNIIGIPTVHIYGSNDLIDPGQGPALKDLCDPKKAYVYKHQGGHEVPGPKDKDALIESANMIRRMLAAL